MDTHPNGEIAQSERAQEKVPHSDYQTQFGSETMDRKYEDGSTIGPHPGLSRRQSMHPHDSVFSPMKQAFQLLKGGVTRLLITFALLAAEMGLLKSYSNRHLLSKTDKRNFNAVVTGLSILLGLNIASAMKTMAGHLRWKSMATGYMNPREINLFMSIESVTKVCQLTAAVITKRPLVSLMCAFWVLISIGAQIGIAVIGLTYSVDTATESLMFVPGIVLATNFTELSSASGKANTSDPLVLRSIAQAAGATALNSIYISQGDPPLPGAAFKPPGYLYQNGDTYEYFLVDYDEQYSNPAITNRNASADVVCKSFPVSSGANGDTATVTYQTGNTLRNLTVGVTKMAVTTFITNNVTCGDRCSSLDIFQARDAEGDTNSATVFSCNVTLNQISNTTNVIQMIPDDIARAITSAITAQNGFQPPGAAPNSASYDSALLYGLPSDNSPTEMASFLNMYVVGIVASLDQVNGPDPIYGMTPTTANSLSVEWRTIWIIVGLLAGCHALLLVATTLFSSRALIPHDSPLTLAKVLTPVVDAADAHKHGNAHADPPRFVYSYREDDKHYMQAEFAQDLRTNSIWSRFPSDWYKKTHL